MTWNKKWIKRIVIIVLVVGVGYFLISPLWRVMKLDEPLPSVAGGASGSSVASTTIIASGAMMPANHGVAGTALIVRAGDQDYLRFENLATTNGPDLHIYLAADQSNGDSIDLGPIRATEGNVNYPIPAGTDTAKYHYALIWCVPFHVLFSYADLK
jgi:Electron transfer DM13